MVDAPDEVIGVVLAGHLPADGGRGGNLALTGVYWIGRAKLIGNLALSWIISTFRAKLQVWEH